MATWRSQVVFPMFTNLPGDVMTNTFHWIETTPLTMPGAIPSLTAKLLAFYQAVYNGSLGMASYMRPSLAVVNWYNLSDPPPRAPTTVPLGGVIPTVTSNMPTEVASVLSFQAVPVSGEAQSRRRGRIYLGALPHGSIEQGAVSLFPQFTTAWVSGVVAGADTHLLNAGVTGVRWAVWSPTTGSAHEVNNGWVDNSPDTQRRRSVAASSRTLWS